MRPRPRRVPTALLLALGFSIISSRADDLQAALDTLRAVTPEGQGNAAAARAWNQATQTPIRDLPRILAAFDGASPLAVNYLLAAVDTLVARESRSGASLPLAALGEFLLETSHHPEARRWAFDTIRCADPTTADRLLPGLLNDPSPELRRDAVDRLLAEADLARTNARPGAVVLYRQALTFAREVDQIERLASTLRELREPVDLPRCFGWLQHWKVIGPFDNTGGCGFDATALPEREIDLAGSADGKTGPVRWLDFAVSGDYGKVDFNRVYGRFKGVTGYAFTEFHAEHPQPAELRLGCQTAWKLWLNGAFVFGREEYHRGVEIDQYRVPVTLQAGRNTLLVKVCQDEQNEEWTVEWEFQIRITDAQGAPLRSTQPPAFLGGGESTTPGRTP